MRTCTPRTRPSCGGVDCEPRRYLDPFGFLGRVPLRDLLGLRRLRPGPQPLLPVPVGLVLAVRRLGGGAAVSACGKCGGSGTVRVQITNSVTGKTQTLIETCLSCMGTGRR
jgi:hypothetical protein